MSSTPYIAYNDLERAEEVVELANKIDPGHALYDWDQANIAMKKSNFTKAISYYGAAAKKVDLPFFNTHLGWSYYYNGQYKEALTFLHKAYEHSPLPGRINVSALSNTYYKMGEHDKANRYLQELLVRQANGEYNLNLSIADIYLERNEIQKSLNYLEKGLEQKDFAFAVYISMSPIFTELENEPRFQKILGIIQSPGIQEK